jgi:hypothetical protein
MPSMLLYSSSDTYAPISAMLFTCGAAGTAVSAAATTRRRGRGGSRPGPPPGPWPARRAGAPDRAQLRAPPRARLDHDHVVHLRVARFVHAHILRHVGCQPPCGRPAGARGCRRRCRCASGAAERLASVLCTRAARLANARARTAEMHSKFQESLPKICRSIPLAAFAQQSLRCGAVQRTRVWEGGAAGVGAAAALAAGAGGRCEGFVSASLLRHAASRWRAARVGERRSWRLLSRRAGARRPARPPAARSRRTAGHRLLGMRAAAARAGAAAQAAAGDASCRGGVCGGEGRGHGARASGLRAASL